MSIRRVELLIDFNRSGQFPTSNSVFHYLKWGAPMSSMLKSSQSQQSGREWVKRFSGSSSTFDLRYPFRTYAEAFIAALRSAGARVTIAATYRPPERAYLMHWAWLIANMRADPLRIPPMDGVDIEWNHSDANGRYSSSASITAAKAMVAGLACRGLVSRLPSSRGTHLDWALIWT